MAYLNEKILHNLNKAGASKAVTKFLQEIIYFELEHFEEEHPRYKTEYEKLIRKYSELEAEKK